MSVANGCAGDRVRNEKEPIQFPWRILGAQIAIALSAAVLTPALARGQAGSPQSPAKPLLLPEANRMPDANDVMTMNQKSARKRNFDAANAERKRQIDDEAAKLLILARDLNSKMENAASGPLPTVVIREAQVIEILANDVKQKMKLTVGGN